MEKFLETPIMDFIFWYLFAIFATDIAWNRILAQIFHYPFLSIGNLALVAIGLTICYSMIKINIWEKRG